MTEAEAKAVLDKLRAGKRYEESSYMDGMRKTYEWLESEQMVRVTRYEAYSKGEPWVDLHSPDSFRALLCRFPWAEMARWAQARAR